MRGERDVAPRPGRERGDSTSLQRGRVRSNARKERIDALSSPREMIARPKMSQNEWKPTELRGCKKLANVSPFSRPGLDGGARHWFAAVSSRGPCCDGGQARDPALMAHHFLGHAGEKRDGPFLFREARFADHLLRPTQYKAPVSRDTAPRVRCFDERKDVGSGPYHAEYRARPLLWKSGGKQYVK